MIVGINNDNGNQFIFQLINFFKLIHVDSRWAGKREKRFFGYHLFCKARQFFLQSGRLEWLSNTTGKGK